MSRNTTQTPIIIDSDEESSSDGGMQVEYSTTSQRRGVFGYDLSPDHIRGSPATYHTTIEQEKKVRSRLREERHAALSVLLDRELLMVQALGGQETLPQTRRRFISKLLAPEDPITASSIRADRFIVQHPSSPSFTPLTVQREIVDVHETGDEGWMKPSTRQGSRAGTPAPGPAPGSPAVGSESVASPAAGSPRRSGSKTPKRAGNSRVHNTQQNRERERRRRWSGAEREEVGFSTQRSH